jgi:hypothetical protein
MAAPPKPGLSPPFAAVIKARRSLLRVRVHQDVIRLPRGTLDNVVFVRRQVIVVTGVFDNRDDPSKAVRRCGPGRAEGVRCRSLAGIIRDGAGRPVVGRYASYAVGRILCRGEVCADSCGVPAEASIADPRSSKLWPITLIWSELKRAAEEMGVSAAEFIRQTMSDRLRRSSQRPEIDPFSSITGLVESDESDLAS